MSGKVITLKNTGGRKKTHSFLRNCFCSNVNLEAKPSEVVGEKGDSFFSVGTGFSNK